MALTLRTDGSSAPNLVGAAWWNDYYDLLTGAMNDQPVYLYYQPASGSNPPALKLQTNGNADLLKGFNSGGTNVFQVDSNGNVTASGTLAVTGAATFSAGVTVSSAVITGAHSATITIGNSSGDISLSPESGHWTYLNTTASGSAYVDNSGNITAPNFNGYLNGSISGNSNYANSAGSAGSATNATNASNIGSIRNGSATNVPIYTGTNTPSSPPTGSIWIKA
jgi:hypothetical protein